MQDGETRIDEISFDGLEPGSYIGKSGEAVYSVGAVVKKSLIDTDTLKRSYGTRSLSFGTSVEKEADFSYHNLIGSTLDNAETKEDDEVQKQTSVFGRKIINGKPENPRRKTSQIVKLEKILAKAYNFPGLSITNIEDLPVSRKEVRRVSFSMKDNVYQIWVFKADPKTTLKELTSYYIANREGIPTAKPIGFVPKEGTKSYPYDLAILGGVVEHAGEPYSQLISKLSMDASCIFKTASSVARLIADFHYKLTRVGSEFEKYGIKLEKASPREEIKQRLLPALKINENNAEGLIKACEKLYQKQDGKLVISHGDIHTRNIVTISSIDTTFGQPRTSLSNFGIIDFGSLMLDYPEGDLSDFWLHHFRDAMHASNGAYNFDYEPFEGAYLYRMSELQGIVNTNGKNKVISASLWNLYEMFDPVRKDELDINQKARFHSQLLRNNLFALGKGGDEVGRELKNVLSKTQYADVW